MNLKPSGQKVTIDELLEDFLQGAADPEACVLPGESDSLRNFMVNAIAKIRQKLSDVARLPVDSEDQGLIFKPIIDFAMDLPNLWDDRFDDLDGDPTERDLVGALPAREFNDRIEEVRRRILHGYSGTLEDYLDSLED